VKVSTLALGLDRLLEGAPGLYLSKSGDKKEQVHVRKNRNFGFPVSKARAVRETGETGAQELIDLLRRIESKLRDVS